MPIRTVANFRGLKITTTLESVEEINLADSDFTIPVDYKGVSQESLQSNNTNMSGPATVQAEK
jgi:hypothetical protein